MDRQTVTPPVSSLSPQSIRAFVTDIGVLGALQVLLRVQGLVVLPILSRGFGVEAYGIWTQFFVTLTLLSTIVSLSLDDPLIRFVAGAQTLDARREHYYSMMAMVGTTNIAASVILLLWPGQIAYLMFGDSSYAIFVQLMAPTLVFEAFDELTLNMLRAMEKTKLYAMLESSQAVVRIVALALTLLFTKSLVTALLVNMAVQVIWLVVQWVLNYRLVGFKWPKFTYVRESLAYGIPVIPTRYSHLILTYSDRLVITHVFGPAAVGVYAASYDLARLCWHVVLPLRMALLPVVSRLWDEGKRQDVAALLSQSFKFSVILGLPAVVGLSALAPYFFNLTATPEFSAASIYIVPMAALGILLNGLMGVFASVMRLHKNTRAIAVAAGAAAIVHLILNLTLIPILGIAGGALATLLGYALELVLIVAQSLRFERFHLPWQGTLVAVVGSALMLPVVLWIASWNNWAALVLSSAVGAAVYLAVALLMRAVTWKELQMVLRGKAA
jgi:O-antigen/teichoic acid export membrane protein